MPAIERTDHLYELVAETVEAGGRTCLECHDTGPGDKLFTFYSVRGARWREHKGEFCSKDCHDRWYGLAPRGQP